MIALLLLLAIVFFLALVFAYLADNPGTVSLVWQGTLVEVSLITAIAATVALIALVMLAWWIIKGIVRAPSAIVDQRRGRTRDKGYRALSEGMLALGAGDVRQARELARQADRRLGHTREPMVLLLEAQTALAEERHDDARGLFDEMLEMKETRPLALRGLFLEAQREGEHAAARHYAERAASLSPHHLWATDACIEYATLDEDYDRALELVDDQERTKSVDKAEAVRKRAVLLAGKAMGELDSNPEAARDHARQAHKLDPTLVPATITEAQAHIRLDEHRKASQCLTDTWKRTTHPEVADLYMNVKPGSSAQTRLSRAKELAAMRDDDVEALLAVAHAALDADEIELAREKATEAVRKEPREGAFLLLADIEEAANGSGARVRHWLQAALRAPRDPAWIADGYVSETWAPVSPVTGRFDAFEWRRPARELEGQSIDADEALRALPPSEMDYGPRGSKPDETDIDEAEVVTLSPSRSERVVGDSAEDVGMVDMDRTARPVAPSAVPDDAVTVTTGSSRVAVGGSAPQPRGSEARSSSSFGTPNGLAGIDDYALAATTPPGGGPGAVSTTPAPGGRSNDDDGGHVLADRVGKRPGAMSAGDDMGDRNTGTDRVAATAPARELRGVDLKSRTATATPSASPAHDASTRSELGSGTATVAAGANDDATPAPSAPSAPRHEGEKRFRLD